MQGICARLPITTSQGFQRDKVESNSTGADFDDASLAAYLDEIKFQESLVKVVRRLSEIRKSIVVFTRFVKEAEHLASQVESCEIVTAETPAKERDRLINDWKDGKIKTLANVGILTTGVDYPELETVVLARPTKSLALYYQMCLDMETEILTDRGFVKYSSLSKDVLVAAFENGTIRWVPIKSITYRPMYDGEYFVQLKNPHMDFKVTNQHDLLVKYRGKTTYQKVTAEKMLEFKRMHFLPVSGVQDVSDCRLSDWEVLFLGLFLSDGHLNKKTNAITIVQSTSAPERVKRVQEILDGCGFKYGACRSKKEISGKKYSDCIHFYISKGKPRGVQKDKRGWSDLEAFIDKNMNANYELLSQRQFELLLEGVNLGDGSKGNYGYTRRTYRLAMGINELYADRFQSLSVRRGFRCNKASMRCLPNGKIQYILYVKKVSTSSIAGTTCKDEMMNNKIVKRTRPNTYLGNTQEYVWCVENEVGTIVTRRNGKVLIMGNCGRAIRTHPNKKDAWCVDMTDNLSFFGKVENFHIGPNHKGLWELKSGNKTLTNVYL